MGVYGYIDALEAAGAKVLASQDFGSYQGDWVAKVEYNGVVGYVNGSYGSCSGCDAFQAEFDYGHGETCSKHRYQTAPEDCADCVEAKASYNKRLADFGRPYLDDMFTKEELQSKFAAQAEWDFGSEEVVAWVRDN